MSGRRQRPRVLFVAEAVTLAHVARARMLARSLDSARFHVRLACEPRFDHLFEEESFEQVPIDSIPSEAFGDALNRGAPVYRFDTLRAYAKADTAAIASFDADVVVGDFRLSLGVSARIAGKPYLNVTNAGWSPYAKPRFVVPDIALTRVIGRRLGQRVFDATRPIAFALHAEPLNRLRRLHGMAPLPRDLRFGYTDGDQTLYADVPQLFPLRDAPAGHAFLGAVLWSPRPAPPDWLARVPAERPVAYVALGSSGRHELLPEIVEGLVQAGLCVVVASSRLSKVDRQRDDVFVADVLDGDQWAGRAAIVVCNGGSPTCYQALRHGVPVLGIPSNLDQYLNMTAVADFGAGLLLPSGTVGAEKVRHAASRLMREDALRRGARRLSEVMAGVDSGRAMTEACERAVAGVDGPAPAGEVDARARPA